MKEVLDWEGSGTYALHRVQNLGIYRREDCGDVVLAKASDIMASQLMLGNISLFFGDVDDEDKTLAINAAVEAAKTVPQISSVRNAVYAALRERHKKPPWWRPDIHIEYN